MGGERQRDHEHHADHAPGKRTLAPALEHSRDSDKEEKDCAYRDDLGPHKALPPNLEVPGCQAEFCGKTDQSAVTLITASGFSSITAEFPKAVVSATLVAVT